MSEQPPQPGPWGPQFGAPQWVWAPPAPRGPSWSQRAALRLWPTEEAIPVGARLLVAAGAVGGTAALTVHQISGLAMAATTMAVLGLAIVARGARPRGWVLTGGALAVVLVATTAVRDAPWLALVGLTVTTALGLAVLTEGRTWTGLLVSAAVLPAATVRAAARWRQVLAPQRACSRRLPVLAAVGASGLLLAVFGALFAAADPAWAALVGDALPAGPTLAGHVAVGMFVAVAALGGACLARSRPQVDALAPTSTVRVPRWAWATPLALLDLLVASFVLVQLGVLFGGRRHVLSTRGLTYAQYARGGFWQLLVATALTLAVIATAVRLAPRATRGDWALIRGLLGALACSALVVVASAIRRMSLYEHTYGWTRLRLLVTVVELILGAVLVLLLIAGVRLSGQWLPRAALLLAGLSTLALVLLNPDD